MWVDDIVAALFRNVLRLGVILIDLPGNALRLGKSESIAKPPDLLRRQKSLPALFRIALDPFRGIAAEWDLIAPRCPIPNARPKFSFVNGARS